MFKKIYIEITNDCDLLCSFCIKNKRLKKYMTLDEFKIILNKLKKYTNYLYFHVLGEPLMHPNINELINIANDITILTNGENPPEIRADNVKIDTKEIEEVLGNEKIEEIKFKDGSKMKTEGLFIAQGVAGSSDFAKKLGVITNKDKIIVNENMETNIKGLFACGDCTGGLLQISKAVYEGTKARTTINKIYKRKKSKYLEIIWKRHKIKLVNLKVILCLLVIQMKIVLAYLLSDE